VWNRLAIRIDAHEGMCDVDQGSDWLAGERNVNRTIDLKPVSDEEAW